MAKKLLAVVLAVLIATSAMAVTVFADKQIPLYKAADSNYTNFTVTFDIPVYGLYGYLTAGDYMLIDLPKDWFGNNQAKEVKWSIVVNGMSFSLPTIENPHSWGAASTEQAKVTLAYLTHDFDGKDTAIPQTTGYNTVTSFRLVAEMKTPSHDSWRVDVGDLFTGNSAHYRTLAKAQWYKADGTEVPGSVSYAYNWNPQASNATGTDYGVYDFVTKEWSTPDANDESIPLTWDHTLANRALVSGAEAAELVVELNKNIVGQATYSLYANVGDATYATNYENLWWQYNASRKFVSAVSVDGKTDKLVFEVPVSILYETNYGSYNRQFVIFENITLLNSTIMANYRQVDRTKVGNGGGNMGRLSWDPEYNGRTATVAKYDGENINYARTGISGKGVVIGKVPYPDAEETVEINFDQNDDGKIRTYQVIETGLTIDVNKTYVVEFTIPGQNPSSWSVGLADADAEGGTTVKSVGGGADDSEPDTNRMTFKVAGADLVGKEYTKGWPAEKTGNKSVAGDKINVCINDWEGHTMEAGMKAVVKVYDNDAVANAGKDLYSGQDLGSDVMAKAIYLNIKETEADTTPATPDNPTEAGDNSEEVEGDNVNVEDNTPAPAEKNPTTGVAFAVVPMLVAAVAAVLAKKH